LPEKGAIGCLCGHPKRENAYQSIDMDFYGRKKVKGRKHHILTDTLAIFLCVIVTVQNTGVPEGLRQLLLYYFSNLVNLLCKIWVYRISCGMDKKFKIDV
jgi:hypothetical protein